MDVQGSQGKCLSIPVHDLLDEVLVLDLSDVPVQVFPVLAASDLHQPRSSRLLVVTSSNGDGCDARVVPVSVAQGHHHLLESGLVSKVIITGRRLLRAVPRPDHVAALQSLLEPLGAVVGEFVIILAGLAVDGYGQDHGLGHDAAIGQSDGHALRCPQVFLNGLPVEVPPARVDVVPAHSDVAAYGTVLGMLPGVVNAVGRVITGIQGGRHRSDL